MADDVLSWVHFGDLHFTRPGEQNHIDFLAMIDAVNANLAERVSFAVLPGDNADDGSDAQFRIVRDAIGKLLPVLHILPGDHDFRSRTLEGFYGVLGAVRLPKSVVAASYRCLFLDIVSSGTGGPDFRLDDAQLDWIQAELEQAEAAGELRAVFMHAYPADLRAGGERLQSLLQRHRVLCVDMGHTHYNELANDGTTIFMATRSTGQIEEGPVGFSVAAINAGVVSWRFAELAGDWPLVLVTRPADHRLITDPAATGQLVRDTLSIRAKVWSASRMCDVSARIDGGAPIALAADPRDRSLWQADRDAGGLPDGQHRLTVEARDNAGGLGRDTITFLVRRDGRYVPPPRRTDGSDADAIGAWAEKEVLGTQLGPNRNGRQW